MRGSRDSLTLQAAVVIGLGLVCTGCVAALYLQDWWAFLVALALAAMLVTGGAVSAFGRGVSRRPHYLCARCGYDRRGLKPGAPCPECGGKGATS